MAPGKPAPKAPRLDTSGQRKGFVKSKFVNMRGKTICNWVVIDYLFGEDQIALESDWTDHYWEARCRHCGHREILERRQIRGRSQKRCPVCEASRKSDRERRDLLKRLEVDRKLAQSPQAKVPLMIALARAGLSTHEIARELGVSQPSVATHLKKRGVTTSHLRRVRGVRVVPLADQKAKRRDYNRVHQRKARETERLAKKAAGTYRPRGRPQKVAR